MEKFQETALKWAKIQDELLNDCIDFLTRVLEKNNKLIDWSEMGIEQLVYVTYTQDGSEQPQHFSNTLSAVWAVRMDVYNHISMECDDDSDYGIENINTDELYGLCHHIKEYVLKMHN